MASWTAPTTRSTGNLITASIWNTDLVENLKYLKDAPTFDGAVIVAGTLTVSATLAVSSGASIALEGRANNGTQLLSLKNQAGTESWSARMPAGTNLVIRDTVNGVDHLTLTQGATASATFGGDVILAATKKLFLDGGSNVSIRESAADTIAFETNGADRFKVGSAGDWLFGSNIMDSSGTPTITANFNASNTITGTDYRFTIDTVGSNDGAGEVTFGHTWSSTPTCVATVDTGTVNIGSNISTTSVVISTTSTGSRNFIHVICRSS